MYGNTCCDVKVEGHGTSISPSIAYVISGFVASDSESKKTLLKGGIKWSDKLTSSTGIGVTSVVDVFWPTSTISSWVVSALPSSPTSPLERIVQLTYRIRR